MRILIVDDSKAMRNIVMRAMKQAGFGNHEFQEASNGAEALSTIQSSSFDLVLSDWNMPQMTGIQLLDSLRAAGNPIKFGFVTSECSDDMRQTALKSGALFLITKPFTPEAFQSQLTQVKL
jgi:two-component system chemotaxis response regulator CheY